MMKKIIDKIPFFLVALAFSCTTNDLEPTLAQDKNTEGAIVNVDNLYSVLKGMNNIMTDERYYGRDIIVTNEVRSDNCFSNGFSGRFSTQAQFAYNENTGFIWDATSTTTSEIGSPYALIANANIVINTDVSLLEGDKEYGKHIQGQALVLRALAHYDMLRIYGQQHAGGTLGIPVITEFKGENLIPARNSIEETKQAIYGDLELAFSMMDASYDESKILPSKFTAKAIESRVAVYFKDWDRAKSAAKAVIDSGLYSVIGASQFVESWAGDGGPNIIYELAFSGADNLSSNSLAYIYRFPTDKPEGYGDAEVMPEVLDLFEENDVRKDILGYQNKGEILRNMKKYPDTATGSDNIPLVRYEEVILNYVEALLETNGEGAVEEINKITSNRGATPYTSLTKDDVLNERRKELMFEGFRFDDLMRTGKRIKVYGSSQNLIEELEYPNERFAWPIPKSEIDANSNMVQNSGY